MSEPEHPPVEAPPSADRHMTRISRRQAIGSMATLAGATAIGCGPSGGPAVDGGRDAAALPSDAASDAGLDGAPVAADAGPVADAGPPADWRLADGHFVPAKMSLEIITPRPMTEIGMDSPYLWAHEAVRYEVPVGVIGGAWPFLYELVDAPGGMSIGGRLVREGDALVRPRDYGVISWTPPTGSEGSSFSYRVRVTDQELNSAEVTVTVRVQADKFVFVQPGAGGGVGTHDDPLRGFDALYRGNAADATHAGKLAYFRAGAYVLSGGSDTGGNVQLSSRKPLSLRAYPDETPVFDCASAKITLNGGGSVDDLCISGLRLEHGRQDVNNAHFLYCNSQFDRGLFWRNEFIDLGPGTLGNDNPAAIFLPGASPRTHVALLSNRFEDLAASTGGNGVAAYDSFNLHSSLFEANEAVRCRSAHCMWLKGGHTRTTVRGERAVDDNVCGTALLFIGLTTDGGTPRSESVEVSYCRVQNLASGVSATAWINARPGSTSGPIWVYRCSFPGRVRNLSTDTVDLLLERCVLTEALPTGSMTINRDNALLASDALDERVALVGAARSEHLGVAGAEIA